LISDIDVKSLLKVDGSFFDYDVVMWYNLIWLHLQIICCLLSLCLNVVLVLKMAIIGGEAQ